MRWLKIFLLSLVIAAAGIGFWRYHQPLPKLQAEVVLASAEPGQKIQLPWPAYGQAAIGAVGYGVLETHKATKPVPIASIAKVITALSILHEKPLGAGEHGPSITMTEADVQLYRDYLAKDGSVVPVAAGQRISEYQALQAMMLPSANNMADTTAAWVFGSVDDYVDYANQFVQELGMTQTTVADASGFSPKTVSTAKDLVVLGEAALQNPVLASIVSQPEAEFPGVGIIHNVNFLLDVDGIVGIKTGNTDQAGGCYLFGSKRSVSGRSVTVVGAVLGAKQRVLAMQDSRNIITAADKGFELSTVVKAGQAVGRYELPWGGSAEAVTSDELKQLTWRGQPVTIDIDLEEIQPPKSQGAAVGTVKPVGTAGKSVKVVLKQPTAAPSWTWRILH